MTEGKNRPGRPKRDHQPERPARVPLGRQHQFQMPSWVDVDPNKVYRWCVDDGVGSLDAYQAAWWEFVEGPNGRAKIPAGNGNYHFLMCLPRDLYEEDQKLQEGRNIDTLKSQVELEKDDYIPEGRQFVVQEGI